MTEDDKSYYFKKGDMDFLSTYFHTSHFQCKCSNKECVDQKISKELINKLEQLRGSCGWAIEITSGFRCEKQQAYIRKSGQSTVVATHSSHEDGLAADIRAPSHNIHELNRFIEPLFDNIGTAINFTHVDVRPKKPDGTKRRWVY